MKLTAKWLLDAIINVAKIDASNASQVGYIIEVGSDGKWVFVEKPTGTGSDGKDVKVSIGDTSPGFLEGKMVAKTGEIILTKLNAGGNETYEIGAGTDMFKIGTHDTDNVPEGSKLYHTTARVQAIIDGLKGAANGLAELDATGKLPVTQLPVNVKEQRVVADIAARDAIAAPYEGLRAHVLDATADTTVDSGHAGYIYTGSVWVKQYEGESMDLVINWADIQGKPSSSVAEIDAAVAHKDANHAPSDAEKNLIPKQEIITLLAGDIANKYKDLAEIPTQSTAVQLVPVGGPMQEYAVDFNVITDGSDVKRLNWNGLGLDGVLTADDKLIVKYDY